MKTECEHVCVSVSGTYVHFTLVNDIKVVSFITWMGKIEDKQRIQSLKKNTRH